MSLDDPKPPDLDYKCIKTSLKSVVKDPSIIQILDELVLRCHKIVINVLQFIKLIQLYRFDLGIELYKIDRPFIMECLKTICIPLKVRRKPNEKTIELRDELRTFYDMEYRQIQTEDFEYSNLSGIFEYLSIDIQTHFEKNIRQNFVSYVERYVNVSYDKKNPPLDQEEKKKFYSDIRNIKHDLIFNEKTSDSSYHEWIDWSRKKIFPDRPYNKNFFYDIVCSPQDYFKGMVFMMKKIEKLCEKIYNVFPMRTDVIPKHLTFDTEAIAKHLIIDKTKTTYLQGGFSKKKDEIWSKFFKTDKKCFRKTGYNFHYMFSTDGIACSLLFEKIGKPRKESLISKEKYIQDIENYSMLKNKNKNIVGIDPGKSDLIFCSDGNKTFRYTQNQRRKETKSKKFRKILQREKQGLFPLEAELSLHNHKTLDYQKFKDYIKAKNSFNNQVFDFYSQTYHRSFKFKTYINTKQSEQKMINRFKEKFGSSNETIIGFGDWEQFKSSKFHEPTKGKGFRTLFRKAGYQVFLVNEFRTSKKCFKCEGDCLTFRKVKNPRPWKDNIIKRHGLIRCKTCSRLWNRDVNGSLNIRKIVSFTIEGKGRPEYLQRTLGSH